MGIYNRDYYRESPPPAARLGLDELTPTVKFLLLANIIVFVLQVFLVREVHSSPLEKMRRYMPQIDRLEQENPEAFEAWKKQYEEQLEESKKKNPFLSLQQPAERVSLITEWFELDTRKVVFEGQVWRLLTHAFCHDRFHIWHIVVNMLLLYWFGGTLEWMYGSREFLFFYLTGAVVAALAFMGMDLYTGSTVPAIGASGAVMAVMMLYTMHFPYETIFLFWILPLQMRWLMLFYVIYDLHPVLLSLSGDRVFTGIAHAAHLGGAAFGFLYSHYQWRLEPLVDRIAFPSLRWQRRPRLRLVRETISEAPPVAEPALAPAAESETDRLDDLLKKIYESGQASLTEEERDILRRASERMKNRSR
jgi:membrane associated rhomboid family serine protease